MRKSKRQIYLEKELKKEKLKVSRDFIKNHNKGMVDNALKFREELRKNATKAEKKLLLLLADGPLCKDFEFQHIVYVKKKGKIERFYIADFCFPAKKIIIELDGEYHYTTEQIQRDRERTLALKRCGYTVYRIDNDKILYRKDLNLLITELIKMLGK